MNRWVAALAAVGCVALVSGCGPMPTPTPTPTVTSSAPTPSATPTATATPTPAALPPLVLPACDDIYTDAQVTELMGDRMELIGDVSGPEMGGYGAGFPELQAILESGDSVNCTWILPASERGLSVSIMLATDATQAAVASVLTAAGASGTGTGGDSIIYATGSEETPDSAPYTEAHYLSPEIWVSAHDVHGTSAPALTQAAMDRMADLNPEYFVVP